jgi:Protein of unknown function (DUF1353)
MSGQAEDLITPGFLTPLRMQKLAAQRWLLIDDLAYRTALLRGVFVVPRGVQTDLASIPRVFWTLFPKEDLYDAAAVVHDAAYAGMLRSSVGPVHLTKAWADELFREAMRASGVAAWRAELMYRAVSWFGDPAAHPLAASARLG